MTAYRTAEGAVVFSTPHPLPSFQLPCGQCIGCRIDKARQWSIRVMHESQLHDRSSFVTLTYDERCLPLGASLCKRDWQLFAKKLRKAIGPFRFFMCGEYGESSLRPHYHAIIFGEDFKTFGVGSFKYNDTTWGNKALDALWGHGRCRVGALNMTTARYVADYTTKRVSRGSLEFAEKYSRYDSNTGECWDVEPEFLNMSRRPGIGAMWYSKFKSDLYGMDRCVMDGKFYGVPRYYDGKLSEEELLTVKAKRREAFRARSGDATPERLVNREANAVAKYKAKRSL